MARLAAELEELYKPDEMGAYAPDFTQQCDSVRARMRQLEKEIEKLDPGAFASSYSYELPPEIPAPAGSHALVPVPESIERSRERKIISGALL